MTNDANQIDVEKIAHLARITLSQEEIQEYQPQLEAVVTYIHQLNELDLSGVEPTAHAILMQDVVRADDPRPSLDHEVVMRNAPSENQGLFSVPKIIE